MDLLPSSSHFIETLFCSFFIFSYFCKKRGMKEKVIFLLLIIMLLASCAGNRKYDDLMQRADSIMNVDDDSAKVAIRMLEEPYEKFSYMLTD